MHASLAVTPEGLPLGLAAARFWSRSKFKGTNALKRHVNPTRVPIEGKESMRCWLANMRDATALLARRSGWSMSATARTTSSSSSAPPGRPAPTSSCAPASTASPAMADTPSPARWPRSPSRDCIGVEIEDGVRAVLELRYKRIRVLPPIGKQKRYPALDLAVIHARERDAPCDRAPVDWRLITDLPVERREDAIEKLAWYGMRWKIELFHKILKSGCRAEDSRLRTAERLVN